MANYRIPEYSQGFLVPIDFSKQILPGTFEFTINELIDNKIDLSQFDDNYNNNYTGAPAYQPAVLLKIILYAYYKGIFSSRKIEEACHQNIIFMALTAGAAPHFTTLANFVSSMGDNINKIFLDVLLVCDELNLIGYENFALDGCKVRSNAAKEWSGKKQDFINKRDKFKKTLALIQRQHKENDQKNELPDEERKKYKLRISKIKKKIDKLTNWINNNEDKKNTSSIITDRKAIQSNLTDNDSAKMQSSSGIIQGYNCQTIVDSKSQIICYSDAVGHSNDNRAFIPAVDGVKNNLISIGKNRRKLNSITYLADTGYHNAEALDYIYRKKIKAVVPDKQYRKRDPRFATKGRHVRPYNSNNTVAPKTFRKEDFKYDPKKDVYICPENKVLKCYDKNIKCFHNYGARYRSLTSDCNRCLARRKCLSKKSRTRTLVVTRRNFKKSHIDSLRLKMMKIIDSEEGRKLYSMRMGIIEPVFANICAAKKLNRFNLRGKRKVGVQWSLFCLVHNIEKIKNTGFKKAA